MDSSGPFTRNKSYLLPTNRSKLRNLTSIAIRNISLSTPVSPKSTRRSRGKTIDDDAIPQTLQSPAKLVALRERELEGRGLEHSRSSADLRAANDASLNGTAVDDGTEPDGTGTTVTASGSPSKGKLATPRPRMPGRMRRRSTLEWAHSTPQRRQERLARALEERMVDVFFSLHVEGIEEPIYVSETVEKTMNATFHRMDLDACGPGIMRCERVVVKVWVRREQTKWRVLLEMDVGLGNLQYLGKSLDALDTPLPANSLLFQTIDGIYTTPPSDLASISFQHPSARSKDQPLVRSSTTRTLPSSTFDSLLRLGKLDDSIQDALATRDRLAADLETLLRQHKSALEDRDRVAEADDRIKTISYARTLVGKQIAKARAQISEKRTSLSQRRELMQSDLKHRSGAFTSIRDSRTTALPASRDELSALQTSIHAQRRRVASTLSDIYPITPLPGNKALCFKILDIHLPNSDDLDAVSAEHLAASLGYVAAIVERISFYLRTPLVYPVNPRQSTSSILDTISKLPATTHHPKTSATSPDPSQLSREEITNRTYPLTPHRTPRFRFEYGVFLLAKDVQVLLESVYGVRVPDIRPILANVKYLLYIASAGEGELPARKAGGVRGLMAVGSRVNSVSSVKMGREGNGKLSSPGGVGAVESLRRAVRVENIQDELSRDHDSVRDLLKLPNFDDPFLFHAYVDSLRTLQGHVRVRR